MSATRPAIEFSIGIMPSAARSLGHRREGVLEARAGQGRQMRIGVAAGDVGIRARLSLIGDLRVTFASCSRAAARSAVEIAFRIHRSGGFVQQRRVDAHAGLERAQLLQPLALFERGGRQRDEALQRRAAKGVDADVLQTRPFAIRRRRR